MWLDREGIKLTVEDRDKILRGEWLKDNIITAFNVYLNVIFHLSLAYKTLSLEKPNSSRLRMRNLSRFYMLVVITMSTVGCCNGEVNWFDSLHLDTPTATKTMIAGGYTAHCDQCQEHSDATWE